MSSENNIEGFPWGRTVEALAWALLVVAFVIGQIAAQTDYESLLKRQMSGVELERSQVNPELPIVFKVSKDGVQQPEVVIMSEGIGYGGPLILGIKAKTTNDGAMLSEIILLSHKETPAFIDRINNKSFYRQFAGDSVTSNFIIGDDIDAVSGATVTSEGFTAAIRDAVHLGAAQHLNLERTWQVPGWRLGLNEFILVALFLLAFYGVYRKDKLAKYVRYAVMVGALLFVGFYANLSLNLGNIGGIFMGYVPTPKQHPLWWILMVGTLGSVLILGRNIYCHQICPFKVVQDLLQKLSGIKLKIKPELQRKSRMLIFILSWAALMLIFLSAHPALGSYEPFAMMFSLEGLGIQWYILPAALLGSLFVPLFWCRLFCPVGLYLNEMVRLRRSIRDRFFGGKSRPETKTVEVKMD